MELPLGPLPIFSFSLFVALVLLLLLRKFQRRKNLPPSPWCLPIIGNLHQLSSKPHHSLLRLSQRYGPLMFLRLGSFPTLVVSSSDAMKSIFKTHDLIFSNRPVFQAAKYLSFDNSNVSFAPYGDNWRQARKLCVLHLLCSKRVLALRGLREHEVSNLVAAVRKYSPLVDLSKMVLCFSTNVVCRAVFGEKHGGGEGVYEGNRSWLHGIMEDSHDLVVEFCFGDFFKGMGWVDCLSGQRGRVEKTSEKLWGFYDRVIEEHQERVKEEDEEEEAEDFVDVLLRVHKDASHGDFLESIDHVKAIMGDIFFAATETTSATIIWTMTELMRNPRVMSKSQEELRDAVGDKNKVQETDLQQLEYLKLVIKETLRLHPPAPLLVPRETLQSCRIQGYDIPAKTRVLVNALGIATDPKTWNSPERFCPERFSSGHGGVDLKGGPEFDFVPFGVGRRSCPGVEFAAVVVELVLANLLHSFEWELPDGMRPEDVDMEDSAGLVAHKKVPLLLVAKPKL